MLVEILLRKKKARAKLSQALFSDSVVKSEALIRSQASDNGNLLLWVNDFNLQQISYLAQIIVPIEAERKFPADT